MSRFGAIKTSRSDPATLAAPPPASSPPPRTPARIGKKAVGGYFTPQLSQALNILAVEQDKTLQALLGEAIDDLMRKYGKHPFGER